jgi:hypothetical protein
MTVQLTAEEERPAATGRFIGSSALLLPVIPDEAGMPPGCPDEVPTSTDVGCPVH